MALLLCGISCIVDLGGDAVAAGRIEKMNAKVRHRGPDGDGVFTWRNVGLGHTRLAIIDLDARASQPMHRDGYHLSFNGEIYNYREIRAALEREHFTFHTQSDTEVLLAALAHWGVAALPRLNGMFAFAFLNTKDKTLILARDRFGKKPLAYAFHEGCLIAASEAKQMFPVMPAAPRLNTAEAYRFIVDGELNGREATFFDGIQQLPPGSCLNLDLATGTHAITRWYSLESHISQTQEPYGAARERVRSLLSTAIARRHVSDVPVGACLSGGIDSSAIVALSSTLFPGNRLRTITTYGDYDGCDERHFSREIIAKFDLDAIEIKPDVERLWDPDLIGRICACHDQPILGGSQINEFRLFEEARRSGCIVMLDGQGSDEYFGGYGEFWFSAQIELLRKGELSPFKDGIKARAMAQQTTPLTVMKRFVRSAANALRKRQYQVRDTKAWMKFTPAVQQPEPPSFKSFTDLSLEEIQVSSIPWQVHSEDRSSMHWSVESRLPFLDHELVEYVLGLPTEYKCNRGRQKSILRDAVGELPENISNRADKIAFASPDAQMFKRNSAEIRPLLHDALDGLKDLIAGEKVMRAFEASAARAGAYNGIFFRVFALNCLIRSTGCTI